MKKVLLSFLLLIAILVNQELIFAVEKTDEIYNKDKVEETRTVVNKLLKRRSELWNRMFSKNVKAENICKELEEIVVDPLLSYDIDAFKKLKSEYTNMDKILDVKVVEVKNINFGKDKMTVEIKVEWFMEGMEKKYKENISYCMTLMKDVEKWKISDYNIL
ncbi:MAG: hypothetical protein PWQ37_2605 [Candidatus Petromonas sp.]|jgi:hypothetical protein|nr:hypothetical protein [Candidatus Petromonas sp.]